MDALIECVPNFSEGTDAACVEAIVAAMQVDGVHLLDWSMDADHNRSVVTIAGEPAAVVEAAVRGAGKAAESIDLTRQQGVHPRIGAADVIPFVPVKGIKLEQCVLLARQAGLEIWRRFGVPVYFYEAAAMRPDRVNLEDVRRGQFEGLRDAVEKEPSRRPDLGGPGLHPTAGACAVGARKFLVAYNIYFDSAERGHCACHCAGDPGRRRRLEGREGHGRDGPRACPAFHEYHRLRGDADLAGAPKVSSLAARHKVALAEGEVIGLIPEAACERESEWMRQLSGFDEETQDPGAPPGSPAGVAGKLGLTRAV